MNDDLIEFERLFDLPDQFDGLTKKIDQLDQTVRSNGTDNVRLTVFQAVKAAADIHLEPAKRAAATLERAQTGMAEAARQALVQRRWIWILIITMALLLTGVAGLVIGRSPALNAAILKTEVGCELIGGRWLLLEHAGACAFSGSFQR